MKQLLPPVPYSTPVDSKGGFLSVPWTGFFKQLSAGCLNVRGTNTNDMADAGYVGEYMEAFQATPISVGASNQYFDGPTLTLTAGDWDVYGAAEFNRNGATYSTTDFLIGISGAAGNSATGLFNGVTSLESQGAAATGFTNFAITLPTIRVQSDGTNLYIASTTFSSVQVVRLKLLTSGYSAATPSYNASIRARRMR